MSEIDTWISVFELLEYELIDEFVGPGKVNFIRINNNDICMRLYFNRKNKKVLSLLKDKSNLNDFIFNKKIFYESYIELFRCAKLNQLSIK